MKTLIPSVLAALALCLPARADGPDHCLAFVTTNLAKGSGNWYTYYRFADTRVKVAEGDVLSYRVYLDPANPEPKGGIDADFDDHGPPLRDCGLTDDAGVRVHGDGDLSAAKGKWLTRRIDLTPAKGRTIVSWSMAEEGDTDGRYIQFIDDIVVTRKDGSKVAVYTDGTPTSRALAMSGGYTREPVCVAIDSSLVKDGAPLNQAIARAEELGTRFKALDHARSELEIATRFAERDGDAHLKEHVEEAAAAIARAERENATAEEVESALHTASGAVSHVHPAMEKFTGHLVGHAHIDLQWLWEWQEGIVFSHDTFAQAVKFMNEFPGFTFSQSSSCLYQAMEEHYPDLFNQIKEKVSAGQWEIVGGRICEGDTNMISEESTVRQFLYGQRYFRERFGRTATVGWEPDTFGHTIQMPQILKLAGCDSYYFCRGGKKKPLFWWQGLDGTRVLAFDEPATDSWYNSDLSYKVFQEMLDFNKDNGSKDMLWVYGVGNHGGGPTREQIEWALEQMKSGARPNIRFSTATEFFNKLRTYDLAKIPVISEELNPVFDGCYTTHCEIKQLNRQAETTTTTAEAVATVASLNGFKYPRAEFRRNWEDICFNHHHDTLPGSGHHAPYERTKTMLGRVIASDQDIITRALESIAVRIKPAKGGINVMVFNPSGWTRSGWVETYLVKSGWDRAEIPDVDHCVARAPDGKTSPAVLEDQASRRVRFLATDVPAFGYKVFELVRGETRQPTIEVRDDGATVVAGAHRITFDRDLGCIKQASLASSNDSASTRELGRLEVHWEQPQGMSAWTLGKIAKVDVLKPTSASFAHGSDYADATFTYVLPAWNASGQGSTVVQHFRVNADGDITCDVDCDWNGVGTRDAPNALLRVAFDTNTEKPVATYQVPFGALSRAADGREFPALRWVDLSSEGQGVAVISDSKHGFGASGPVLTMSLIRSPFEPDPVPNPGHHHWRYAVVPHRDSWKKACVLPRSPSQAPASINVVQRAAEFDQPLLAATVPYDSAGPAPLQWNLLEVPARDNIVPTALKRAEDDDDIIVRMYESRGDETEQGFGLTTGAVSTSEVNLIEDHLAARAPAGGQLLSFHPFEIKTLKIKPAH